MTLGRAATASTLPNGASGSASACAKAQWGPMAYWTNPSIALHKVTNEANLLVSMNYQPFSANQYPKFVNSCSKMVMNIIFC